MSKHQTSEPPQPPDDFSPHLSFYPFQLIGIPLLFLIPILALFGVFGETKATLQGVGNGLEMEVTYSNRVLFQGLDGSDISVTNTTNDLIPTLTVTIETAFLDNFSDVDFAVSVTDVTDNVYIIELTDVQPGETRRVSYESRGAVAGSHRGIINAFAGASNVSVTVESLIIP